MSAPPRPGGPGRRAGPADRRRLLGFTGGTLWVTGLSGAGKSTLAGEIERRLLERGRPVMVLDGDVLRTGLNADLRFDRPAREENVRRVGEVALLTAGTGLVVVSALISPYATGRKIARDLHAAAGIPFVEVYLSTPIDVCEARDPKGLYARARSGDLVGMTGVDDPYEAPEHPDIEITVGTGVGDAAGAVLDILDRW